MPHWLLLNLSSSCALRLQNELLCNAKQSGLMCNQADLVVLSGIRFYIELNMPGNSERLFIIKLGFSSSLPIVSS